MSKQVLIDNKWYDVSYIQQDGPTNRFIIVYQDNGKSRTASVNSGWLRDKPKEVEKVTVDWTKPVQIKCGEWHDIIFHKRYGDVIALIFERDGEPVYVNENMDDFNIRGLTIRNRPLTCTFERWVVCIKGQDEHKVYTEKKLADDELDCQLKSGKSGYTKHIKVEWEL